MYVSEFSTLKSLKGQRGFAKPLCKAVKVIPEFYWRPQDFGQVRDMGYMSWRHIYRKEKQTERDVTCRQSS